MLDLSKKGRRRRKILEEENRQRLEENIVI